MDKSAFLTNSDSGEVFYGRIHMFLPPTVTAVILKVGAEPQSHDGKAQNMRQELL